MFGKRDEWLPVKRSTTEHTQVNEIRLRAIGLEMEIYMDDFKEEELQETGQMFISHLL